MVLSKREYVAWNEESLNNCNNNCKAFLTRTINHSSYNLQVHVICLGLSVESCGATRRRNCALLSRLLPLAQTRNMESLFLGKYFPGNYRQFPARLNAAILSAL